MPALHTAKFFPGGSKMKTAAKEGDLCVISATDGEDFTFVKAGAKGATVHGIVARDVAAGGTPLVFDVSQGGIAPVRLGATLKNGAELIAAADAHAIGEDTAGQVVFGILMQDGGDGDLRPVNLQQFTKHSS